MQKRTQIFGIPYWVGVYQEAPHEWLALAEVRGHSIAVVDKSEQDAIDKWRREAEIYLSKAQDTFCPPKSC